MPKELSNILGISNIDDNSLTCPPKTGPGFVLVLRGDLRPRIGGRDESETLYSGAGHWDATGGGGRVISGQGGWRGMQGSWDYGADLLPLAQRIWGDESNTSEAFAAAAEGEFSFEAGGGRVDVGQVDFEGGT